MKASRFDSGEILLRKGSGCRDPDHQSIVSVPLWLTLWTAKGHEESNDSVLHDRSKRLRIERCAAHQGAVDLLFRHECRGIVRLDRPPVEDA